MKRIGIAAFWAFFFGIVMGSLASADATVRFSEEELAAESVLPIFDEQIAVRKRVVETDGRIEFGAVAGLNLNEAFYDYFAFGAQATYHMSNVHAFQIWFNSFAATDNQFAKKLDTPTFVPNLKYVPPVKMLVLGSYEFSPVYGKISMSKQMVSNLVIYGTVGAGLIMIGDGSSPLLSVGLGQKFYFSPRWGLNFDIRGLFYNGPDPLSKDLSAATKVASYNDFSKKSTFNFTLLGGFFFMF